MIVSIIIALICAFLWCFWDYKSELKDIKTKGVTLADKFDGKEEKPELSRYISYFIMRASFFGLLIVAYWSLQE